MIMKNVFAPAILFVIVVLSLGYSEPSGHIISTGLQPQLSMDNKGVIRIVFGRSDSIFCSTSEDEGQSFTKPVLVAHIPGMHLGMTRGPQIASSAGYSVITAIDKTGNIHFFQLDNSGDKWVYKGLINDLRFAREWVDYVLRTSPRSQSVIRQELVQKGIPENIIDESLSHADFDEKKIVRNLVLEQMKKYVNDVGARHALPLQIKAKIFRFLVNKGFDAEMVEEMVDSIIDVQNQK